MANLKNSAKQPAAVEMTFPKDMFYDDMKKPLYLANKIYVIAPEMVDRWLKRGGVIVKAGKPVSPTVIAPAPQNPEAPKSDESKGDDKKGKE